MNGAIDYKTQIRVRRAMVKARFSLADAQRLCVVVPAPGFFGAGGAAKPSDAPACPCCRAPDVRAFDNERFWCRACQSSGDQVTWVMAARSVSTGRALDLIEASLGASPPPRSEGRRS